VVAKRALGEGTDDLDVRRSHLGVSTSLTSMATPTQLTRGPAGSGGTLESGGERSAVELTLSIERCQHQLDRAGCREAQPLGADCVVPLAQPDGEVGVEPSVGDEVVPCPDRETKSSDDAG
jgi:hypothetical protein